MGKKIATTEEIQAWFEDALTAAFEKTGIDPQEFTWFNNKPLNNPTSTHIT